MDNKKSELVGHKMMPMNSTASDSSKKMGGTNEPVRKGMEAVRNLMSKRKGVNN